MAQEFKLPDLGEIVAAIFADARYNVAQEFKLPDLGEGVLQGDVVRVLVAEGDTIAPEQPIIEIETDKAVVEVPASFGGRITKLHVKQGDKIPVGQVLITVEADASAAAAPSPQADSQSAVVPVAEAQSAETKPAPSPSPPPAAQAAAPQPAPAEPAASQPATPQPPASQPANGKTDEIIPAGPATRRLARELGVDLQAVAAARPGARLTEDDVKAFVKQRMTSGQPATPGTLVAAPPLPDFAQWGPIERVPLSSLQRKTAETLQAAWVGPHVTQFDEADITELENLRKRHRDKSGESGVKLTVTAFVLKAAAIALRELPQFNTSFDAAKGELIFKKYYHIGVAVDTPAGLVVVVVRDVNSKRILDIAAEMNDLADRARQRKTTRDEMRGSTLTVTNLGGIGGTAFTPIVNYPEVAILGLARSRNQPVHHDGQWTSRLVLPLCLSYDHRIINGADGARFTRRIAGLLEDPEMLLLEE